MVIVRDEQRGAALCGVGGAGGQETNKVEILWCGRGSGSSRCAGWRPARQRRAHSLLASSRAYTWPIPTNLATPGVLVVVWPQQVWCGRGFSSRPRLTPDPNFPRARGLSPRRARPPLTICKNVWLSRALGMRSGARARRGRRAAGLSSADPGSARLPLCVCFDCCLCGQRSTRRAAMFPVS